MLPPRPPQRTWLSAALLSAALLILPAVVWLLAPRPSRLALPPPPRPPRPEATALALEAARAAPPAKPSPAAVSAAPPASSAPPEVAPPAAAAVTGLVLDPSGAPLAGATVRCEDRPDQELSAQSADEGRFELPPEAAGCLAVARHDAHNPSEGVKLVAGRQNVLRLRGGGAIEGTAEDEGGRPVARYRVAVESFRPRAEGGRRSAPGLRSRSVEDPAGAFRLEDLAPGTYILTASAEGRPPAKSAPIEVEAGQVTRHARIVLARGARLSGRVIDAATRAPLEGAVVTLDAVTNTDADLIAPARTDAAGVYTIEGAPTGPFSIRVEHDGYRTKIVPGIVARGATTAADVVLTPRADGGGDMELAGIGAVLAPSPEGVILGSVLPGGPADGAGLRSGDLVARIDGASATQLPVSDCIQRLRGAEGSRVTVGVKRDGQIVEITVTRRLIVQ